MSSFENFRTNSNPTSLENLELEGKNVILRVDFNCPSQDGVVTNNYRIQETLDTLNLLKLKKANKITLMTHWGRPKGKFDPALNVKPLCDELNKLWGEEIICPEYCEDFQEYSKKVQSIQSGVIMWDNIRFWPGEKENDSTFAKALSEGQDIFINEAFSASHRGHASVLGITNYLPSYAGLRLGKEVREIFQLMTEEIQPSLAIVGGAKIETKLPVLRTLEKHYDRIILGGRVALEWGEFQKNISDLDKGWVSKIELPTGYVGDMNQDIDEASANKFAELMSSAKKILWNGPMGKFEEEQFAKGSEILAKALSENTEALRLVGGGDTIEVLDNLDLRDKVGFVSTGGGAMLDYVAEGTLPGIVPLDF